MVIYMVDCVKRYLVKRVGGANAGFAAPSAASLLTKRDPKRGFDSIRMQMERLPLQGGALIPGAPRGTRRPALSRGSHDLASLGPQVPTGHLRPLGFESMHP